MIKETNKHQYISASPIELIFVWFIVNVLRHPAKEQDPQLF